MTNTGTPPPGRSPRKAVAIKKANYEAVIKMSPWAKLISRKTPYTRQYPRAIIE
jgi:hypothetical protein